jgi:hypothetical protein
VHPDIQSRLQDEIDIALKEGEGNLTYEAIHSMKYLDMVVSGMVTSPYQEKWLGLETTVFCHLGVAMVSVLATGPKDRGLKPSHGNGHLRAIKICSTPTFGWEVKLEVPCRKILLHVRHSLTYQRY